MEINFADIEADVSKLTPEQIKQQLLDAKVRQRVASKKYYNPESAKKTRDKRAASLKAQAEIAKGMPATEAGFANLYEQIMSEANDIADAKLAAEEVETAA